MTAFEAIASDVDETILRILRSRSGDWTLVRLRTGELHRVYNITWGIDAGETWYHITSNISPPQHDDVEVGFFLSKDVSTIANASTGRVLYTNPVANVVGI